MWGTSCALIGRNGIIIVQRMRVQCQFRCTRRVIIDKNVHYCTINCAHWRQFFFSSFALTIMCMPEINNDAANPSLLAIIIILRWLQPKQINSWPSRIAKTHVSIRINSMMDHHLAHGAIVSNKLSQIDFAWCTVHVWNCLHSKTLRNNVQNNYKLQCLFICLKSWNLYQYGLCTHFDAPTLRRSRRIATPVQTVAIDHKIWCHKPKQIFATTPFYTICCRDVVATLFLLQIYLNVYFCVLNKTQKHIQINAMWNKDV